MATQTARRNRVATVEHTESFTTTPDGIKLYIQRWIPSGAPRATLAIVHGYLEHSGRYQFPVDYFSNRGFEVFACDLRGHGQSGGRRAHVFHYDEYVDDIATFVRYVVAQSTHEQKLFLVGHSNGGLATFRYAARNPEGLDGIVLSAPYVGLKAKVSAVKVGVAKALSGLWPTLALKTGIPGTDLTRDAAVAASYDADPLVIRAATARWFTEALAAQNDALLQAPELRVPVLIVQGTDDRVADPAATERVFNAVGFRDKEFRKYDGGFHELFNDPDRERVFADIEEWLSKRL